MMNQKAVIYIILSAILLYLYYKRGGIVLFVAFAVVVFGTLILGKGRDIEGFGSDGGKKGGGGSGSGGDSECAKLGFKPVKIDKKDINGSLKKIFANFKTVTSKYVTYDGRNPEPKEEYRESLRALEKFEIIKSEMDKLYKVKENEEYIMNISFGSAELLHTYLMKPEEEARTTFTEKLKKFKEKDNKGRTLFELVLKGGELGSKVLEKIKKSDELKESDKEVKKVFTVIHCSCKQVLMIWKALDKAVGEGEGEGEDEGGDNEDKKKKSNKDETVEGEGDGDGDDEEDKPKNKKKKATKKKKSTDDDDE